MRCRAIVLPLALALGLGAYVRPAFADQQSAEKKAAVETLFEEGKRLKKEGKFLDAARKFEQVQKLDPGIGTLLHLAESYERAGLLASAWGNYKEAAQVALKQGDSRDKLANELAGKLADKLARISIAVGANESVPGLVVSRSGVDLDAHSAEVALPIDSGTVIIQARAPGYETYREEVTIKDGEQRSVKIPPLVKLPEPKKVTPPPASVTPVAPPAVPSSTRGLRYGALAAGLASVAGTGVAVGFALRALKLDDDAAQYCVGTACNDVRGETLSNDALAAGRLATVSTVIAGAAGATAVGLLVGSFFPSSPKVVAWTASPWTDGRAAGMTVGGSW